MYQVVFDLSSLYFSLHQYFLKLILEYSLLMAKMLENKIVVSETFYFSSVDGFYQFNDHLQ